MKKLISLFALLTLCAGCNRFPRPALAPEKITGEARTALITELGKSDAAVSTFKGLARGVLQDGKERAIIRYVILFKKPGKLRIEALPATGAYTLSVLAANELGVTLIDPVGERAYRTSDPAHAIKTALKIPVAPDELTSYLLGTIPAKLLDSSIDIRKSDAGLQVVQGEFSAYWLVDPKSRRLKAVELRRSPRGAPALTITYGEYSGAGDQSYPKELTIDVPGESVHGTISFRTTEFNPELRDSNFSIVIPAGYSVYEGLDRPDL